MNLSEVFFQEATLSPVEQDVIMDCFSSSIVQKYLKILGRNDLTELALLSTQNLSDSEVSKKHALVQGKLSTLVTLLSISKPSKEQ